MKKACQSTRTYHGPDQNIENRIINSIQPRQSSQGTVEANANKDQGKPGVNDKAQMTALQSKLAGAMFGKLVSRDKSTLR